MNHDKFLDNFSTHLKNTIARSISLAINMEDKFVSPLHVITALIEENGSVAAEVLFRSEIMPEMVYDVLHLNQMQKKTAKKSNKDLPTLSDATKSILEKSMLIAYEHEQNFVGTEHLLLALVSHSDKQINQIFTRAKIDPESIKRELGQLLETSSKFPDVDPPDGIMNEESEKSTHPIHPPLPSEGMSGLGFSKQGSAKVKPSALTSFTIELTATRHQKHIDPVIGREREVERLIHILSRRNKNNPVLIGEPGVGKTAIVEGLAKRITEGDVPHILKRKKIMSLDLTLLIAGTIYRGEFESRMKQIIDEVASKPDVILFIDELHNIIGAGSNQGTMDAANILKPALARGGLRCIGATTFDEYKKYITQDPALERRFQSIEVKEPSVDESKKILSGVKKYYESYHNVSISPEAVDAAVTLSSRYIHDSFLPDKALDLIDEASAGVKTSKKATKIDRDLLDLERRLETCREKKEEAIREEKFDRAAELKIRESELEKNIADQTSKIEKRKTKTQKVENKHIAEALSRRMNIPLEIILTDKWDLFSDIDRKLKESIIGQDHVIDEIAKAIKHAHLGLSERSKPLSSFVFAGPSGVGKTELAKKLAIALHHDPKALIRLDMSEFSEAHGVSKLLGSPAGYVGFKERNKFTDEVRRRPHSIILFDEFDKAHSDVQKLLLQILDEGKFTDSAGKTTDFRHSIIILTTNLGAELFKSAGIGFSKTDTRDLHLDKDFRKTITGLLKKELGTALMNRIDHSFVFSPLSEVDIERIVGRHLHLLSDRSSELNGFTIRANQTALSELTKLVREDVEGARQVEKIVANTLYDLITPDMRGSGDVLNLSLIEGKFTLEKQT